MHDSASCLSFGGYLHNDGVSYWPDIHLIGGRYTDGTKGGAIVGQDWEGWNYQSKKAHANKPVRKNSPYA